MSSNLILTHFLVRNAKKLQLDVAKKKKEQNFVKLVARGKWNSSKYIYDEKIGEMGAEKVFFHFYF